MVKLDGIVKKFGGKIALNHFNMNVKKASIYALTGSRGSGKTCALACAAGLYYPDEGRVSIGGIPMRDNPRLSSLVGYLPSEHSFGKSSLERLKAFYKNMYSSWSPERFKILCDDFELEPKTKLIKKETQKKAAFALMMAFRPEAALLDEPFDDVSLIVKERMIQELKNGVKQNGLTVIISSQTLLESHTFADSAGVIKNGQTTAERRLSDYFDKLQKIRIKFDSQKRETNDDFGLDIIMREKTGDAFVFIVRGRKPDIEKQMRALEPDFYEFLDLSIDDIFLDEFWDLDATLF